jgi:putative hydrolase of the HAD superfamily
VRTRDGVVRACLVDVYDTILTTSWRERAAMMAEIAGVPPQEWVQRWGSLAVERDTGSLTVAEGFARMLESFGRDPDRALVDELLAADTSTLTGRLRVFDDTVPFLTAARDKGTGVALVSNCADTTRPMLAAQGLLALADVVILSCEVGVAKPDPGIYLIALQELGVLAGDAVMLDDQPGYCAGAESVGVRAIQVVRPGVEGVVADPRFESVPSLLDVLPLLAAGRASDAAAEAAP